MEYVVFFIVSIILVYLFYNIFVIKKENALNRMKKSKDVLLVCKIGNVDIEKVNFKKFVRLLGLTNGFIISTIGTLVLILGRFITNFNLWIIITIISSIILLVPMIFICYKLLGKKINKEGR